MILPGLLNDPLHLIPAQEQLSSLRSVFIPPDLIGSKLPLIQLEIPGRIEHLIPEQSEHTITVQSDHLKPEHNYHANRHILIPALSGNKTAQSNLEKDAQFRWNM